jgi:hypothetical protein
MIVRLCIVVRGVELIVRAVPHFVLGVAPPPLAFRRAPDCGDNNYHIHSHDSRKYCQ